MATTGILLRGSAFNTMYADAPIPREIGAAGEHIGYCTFGGVVYWLNANALSKIGKILDSSGNTQVGFKTTDLPIFFDGGFIKEEASSMKINDTYNWNYAALGAITELSATLFNFSGLSFNVPLWYFVSNYKPTIVTASLTSIQVTFVAPAMSVEIKNESTGVVLGVISTSNGVLSFASQVAGQKLTAVAVDASYNKSTKAVTSV